MAEAAQSEEDIRPVVRTGGSGNIGLIMFLAFLAVAGLLLFQALNARRTEVTAPATLPQEEEGGIIAAPPPLSLPKDSWSYAGPDLQPLQPAVLPPASPPRAIPERVVTRVVEVPRQAPADYSPQPVADGPARPAIVYDSAVPPASGTATSASEGDAKDARVLASRLANPSVTVPKGTVIPAVLESALDSTRAGAARAIVSRDVRSFDGSHILIPRGSQLYGEYESDLNYGQNRALVLWTRLTRPDAVIINLDSPSADPLGRAGIRGKVHSHFWSRFGSAILQSTLDIGVGLATRSVTGDGVFVALPGSTQNLRNVATEGQSQVRPTLTVKQGTSVSVFVTRDLDFSTVEK